MQNKFKSITYLFLVVMLFATACEEKEYQIPDPVSDLTTDVIKRTLGPNIVGLPIDFAFAMAIPKDKGKLVSAQVEATIAGAPGTTLENRSFFTYVNGSDSGIVVGTPAVNKDNITTVAYSMDTMAATLRYHYVIPEAARGKTVSFKFTATASNGKTSTYDLGPYAISKMDIVKRLTVSNDNKAYISISDLAVYDNSNVAANAAKVDLIYLYRATPSTFSHGLVSPAADAIYLPGVTLPAGVNHNTKVRKEFGVQDRNLADLQYGIYVDDKDLQDINLTDAPNYAIGLKAEAGAWVQTADGKYKAYIFINSVNANGSAVISILRYTL